MLPPKLLDDRGDPGLEDVVLEEPVLRAVRSSGRDEDVSGQGPVDLVQLFVRLSTEVQGIVAPLGEEDEDLKETPLGLHHPPTDLPRALSNTLQTFTIVLVVFRLINFDALCTQSILQGLEVSVQFLDRYTGHASFQVR